MMFIVPATFTRQLLVVTYPTFPITITLLFMLDEHLHLQLCILDQSVGDYSYLVFNLDFNAR